MRNVQEDATRKAMAKQVQALVEEEKSRRQKENLKVDEVIICFYLRALIYGFRKSPKHSQNCTLMLFELLVSEMLRWGHPIYERILFKLFHYG